MTGQTAYRALISAISQAEKCEVTTVDVHGYATGQHIRITDIDGMMPINRGMVQLNDGHFLIEVLSTTIFLLKDPITTEYIDSTNYEAYVSGGRVNLENTVFLYSA